MSISVLGSINMDIVLSVAHLPRPGETVPDATLARHAGGKGANQAIAAARAGAPTAMLGAVGDDAFGEALVANLVGAGVDTAGVARLPGIPTGQAYIAVAADGENSIIVVPGANAEVTKSAVAGAALRDHAIFLAQLEVPLVTVAAFLEAAPARAGTRVLNAAPAIPEARPLIAMADIVVINQTELAVFAGAAGPPVEAAEVERLCRSLISGSVHTVVVTLGARGALAVSSAQTVAVPGRPARVVDTTGAGDCFCGALAAAFDAGEALPAALEFANAAAAIAVTRHGASASMPTRAEIVGLLADR